MNQPIGKIRLRVSFTMLAASLAGLLVVFATTTILGIWRQREQSPRLAVDSLVKALRTFHSQTGRFPGDFQELETRIWKHRNPPDFGADNRSLAVANYYYLYYPIDARQCSIWIIPTGPRRTDGSTHFLLLAPENLRRWKGAPLSLDETKALPPVPQYREMALLGMTEQQAIDLGRRTK